MKKLFLFAGIAALLFKTQTENVDGEGLPYLTKFLEVGFGDRAFSVPNGIDGAYAIKQSSDDKRRIEVIVHRFGTTLTNIV